MFDLPAAATTFNRNGAEITRFDREENFEMMLTAVEENSGHIIILATVDWTHKVNFQVDVKKPVHSRLKLTGLETTCYFDGS